MSQKRQKYNIVISKYQTSQYIQSNCGDITFYNASTVGNIFVNDFTLVPGQSIGFSANFNEIDTTQYNIIFDTKGGSSETDTNRELVVIRKIFV